MYFKLSILCIFSVLTVSGFKLLGITNVYRQLMKEIKAIADISGKPIRTKWIEQNLDHYDLNEKRKWKMKYYERLDYWRLNGPIYLFINGESPAEQGFLTTGIMYQLAKETNGAMFLSEHRYYGQSQPVNSTNVEDFKKSKVIVVGGSYAANLAAWMRLIYPELVDAAIASSGPVLAKTDFYEYLEVVKRDFEQYGTPGCVENIQSIFQRYDTLFKTDEGIKTLKEEENICEDFNITEPLNKQLFFLTKISTFQGNAQYGTVDIIKDHCSKINATKDAFVQADDDDANSENENNCHIYSFDSMIKEYRKAENDWALSWTYQTCTEFGYFQTTTSDDQPFTKNVPIEFYERLCTDLFGVGFDRDRVNDGVQKINDVYGGLTPNVTNVVFSNGDLDPWSALGVVEDISYDAPAVYITRSSHCRDLFPDRKGDPEELIEARRHIKYLIKKWIGTGDFISQTLVSLLN